MLAALLLAGCNAEPVITHSPGGGGRVAVRGSDDLSQAFDSLRQVSAGGGPQAASRSAYYLDQWLNGGRNVEGTWEPDPLVRKIPKALQSAPGLGNLQSLEFVEADAQEFAQRLGKEFAKGPSNRQAIDATLAALQRDLQYLQQTQWLHDVASRVRRQPSPAALVPWLAEMEKSVGLPESEQVAAAERLFDWTVRNLQLEPLPPPPVGPAATAGEGTEPVSPALLGQVGPGYGHLPIQLLQQGRGDAHERARLFILLCRQAGIDAVMLARSEESTSVPQPWAAAVLAGKELYLFEPALGLPIPGPDGQGIATLSQVRDDPAVLDQLDMPGGPAYPFAAGDVKDLVALIEAEPDALARRFQLLQEALPSSRRLVLATEPSRLEPKLRQVKGIGPVNLWRVPFEALLYQIGRQNALARDPAQQIRFVQEEALFLYGTRPLMLGRSLHLQGEFEDRQQLPGARTYYLDARVPDEVREKMYTSEQFRQAAGQQLPEMEEQQKRLQLEANYAIMQREKQYASYWLGLTYFETGMYDAAIEWLDLRTLRAPLPTPLAPSARYNLARSYEALGDKQAELARKAQQDRRSEKDVQALWTKATDHWNKARELLVAGDSPQQHGNQLRARWLGGRKLPTSGEGSAPAP